MSAKFLPACASPLRRSLNELARSFYSSFGYESHPDTDFENSEHPQEQGMFNLACIAYEHFNGDQPDPADLEDIEESEGA